MRSRRALGAAFLLLLGGALLFGEAQQASPPPVKQPGVVPAYSPQTVEAILAAARTHGDARRGAAVFASPTLACLSCHKVGRHGGAVGPELDCVNQSAKPAEIVESLIWPKRQVKPDFVAHAVQLANGSTVQGYREREDDKVLVLREPGTTKLHRLRKDDIEERREIGTLMPEGLWASLSTGQQRDLVRFLLELGKRDDLADLAAPRELAKVEFSRLPLRPEDWPNHTHPVNRDRVYDFYTREAMHFAGKQPLPHLLPAFPGLDGGRFGHWGNQNEAAWADDRWNLTDPGVVLAGVFRGAGVTVPRGICVRLGEKGGLSVCFNPETLSYDALWQGGFVRFSSVRHGFMHGLLPDGKPLPRPAADRPAGPFTYRGYYRHGKQVLFAYRIGEVEYLDAPGVKDGRFVRVVAPADRHPLAALTRGGPAQWGQEIVVKGTLGRGRPYAVDTVPLPVKNPWNALLFVGGHDFLPDGTALVCTMQGDVWRATGLDDRLEAVRWRRIASGLHHPLGLIVVDRQIYVQCRDQITRLVDRNGDGEIDFYERFSAAFTTSAAGHDYICGLERDAQGRWYTASGNQGLVRISADGTKAEVLAVGFRNPDGLGLMPDGSVTVPNSEGEWTPASMVCEVPAPADPARPLHFGYRGPPGGKPPALPLVYLPRGLDNSSGGQVVVPDDRWGPLRGQAVHLSFGAGTHFLLLRDRVEGQPQGAVVPLVGDFRSGVHRGRFNPRDGQLYVSGMAGWGTYTADDGCFQRVRYTGDPVQLPVAWRAHRNGVLVRFSQAVDRRIVGQKVNHFAQCWNYRYGPGYGSPELAPRHPGAVGHDALEIAAVHVLADGRSVFLELPDLQPVNQLHLHLKVDDRPAADLFATVHRLDAPFTDFPGYRPVDKVIAAHPILADLARATRTIPNPWRGPLPKARPLTVEAGKNLTYLTRRLTARAGEPLRLTFVNPDVVPHNWVLVKPGALQRVGELANRLIADPEASLRHYVPTGDDVLAYTDVTDPGLTFTIHFRAPTAKGRYPYLCTFPGHWMVMNGELVVE